MEGFWKGFEKKAEKTSPTEAELKRLMQQLSELQANRGKLSEAEFAAAIRKNTEELRKYNQRFMREMTMGSLPHTSMGGGSVIDVPHEVMSGIDHTQLLGKAEHSAPSGFKPLIEEFAKSDMAARLGDSLKDAGRLLETFGLEKLPDNVSPTELKNLLTAAAKKGITGNSALRTLDRVMKVVGTAGGVIGGAQVGSAPGFLLRSRLEDKFKDKKDRTFSEELLAKSPVIGGLAGGVGMGLWSYRTSGLMPKLKTYLSKMAELKSSVALKPHQEHFVQKLLENDGSLLAAHATGTGKTLTGIAGFEKLKTEGKAKRAIVVVPASLRENFVDNLKKYTNSPYSVYGPRGESSSKDIGDKSNADYNLVSYELFREHGDKLIEDTGADTLILDEIHRVRGTEGSTYNKLRDLRMKFRNGITLTGSVVNNEPNDVVPLLDITHTPTGHKMVSKTFFDKLFVRKDAVTRGIIRPKVYVEKNIKNKEQLGNYLRGKVHFVSHEALEKDMPKREAQNIVTTMTKDQQMLYNYSLSAVDPLTRWKIKNNLPVTQKEAKDAFSQLMQARQISTDPAIMDKRLQGKDPYDYSPKVKKVVDDLQEHLGDKPTNKSVIYGNLIKGQLDAVEKALKNKGIPYAKFFGMGQEGMTAKARPKEIEDFKEGKKRVLLISGAGAEGIDLKNTSMLQMLEGHYNPERILQAESRIRRLGSFSHLPEAERKILIKRYMASPAPSKMSKIYSVFGASGGDTGVDKWVYSIAERKDRLNRDFRDALEKVPIAKTATVYPTNTDKVHDSVTEALGNIRGDLSDQLMGDFINAEGHAIGSMSGSLLGLWPTRYLARRRTADVEKNLKQILLDKGKESLINKRHYPKILSESKIDERMIDAELGMGALLAGAPLLGLASPKFRKAINYPSRQILKGVTKVPLLGSKINSGLRKLKDSPMGSEGAASVLTGIGMGAALPIAAEYGKTKLMQWALSGRTQDLDKGIKIYEDKLRKKMERKYKGSKSFVQEVDTKKELGLDILD